MEVYRLLKWINRNRAIARTIITLVAGANGLVMIDEYLTIFQPYDYHIQASNSIFSILLASGE
jgi:hypothetical protein